ncbi:MAG TPA: hypothetical protein VG759_03355 [Candidatus Angelobacter sp.]|jgi:predicted nucleic acid-binding protein|nr:hypothetical protein [Candidatus Angelobacter sp.]
MIIVADTSPINYLVLIKEIEVLPRLYGKIIIPEAVREELLRPEAPRLFESGPRRRLRGSRLAPRQVLQIRRSQG